MKFRAVAAVLMILFISGCGIKSKSWWREPDIAVMADPEDWEAVQGNLRTCFEKVIRTPQIEKSYNLVHVSDDEIERYAQYRYILLVSTLGSTGRVGNLLAELFSNPEVRKRVENGEQNVFKQDSPWARDQIMLVIAANTVTELREVIDRNSQELYAMIDGDVLTILEDEIYYRSYQKEEEQRLVGTYGWTLKMHREFFIAQELPQEGFIWWRRMNPERWLFVRWIEGKDASRLNQDWVVGERNRIGAEYYGGDRLSGSYLFSQRSEFLGRPARITTGLWENEEKVAGGPFRNYTFIDEPTGRLYMIDIAVYAPGRDKYPYLRRLDIIAHTFRTLFDK